MPIWKALIACYLLNHETPLGFTECLNGMLTTDHQRHSSLEPSKDRKAIILYFFEIDKAWAKRSLPHFQDFSNIEKKLNTTMKSGSSNQRLNMIEK